MRQLPAKLEEVLLTPSLRRNGNNYRAWFEITPQNHMTFSLEVGETEKHLVEFRFNQLSGKLVIKLNNREVKRSVRLFSEPIRESHAFDIGEKERLSLRIEKQRKLLYGQKYQVFVNERLVRAYEGI